MATISMEVETIRGVQSLMQQEYSNMTSSLSNLTSSVSSAIGSAWIGNSATEFQQRYEELRNTITQNLELLKELETSLGAEIAQWEETAARLG